MKKLYITAGALCFYAISFGQQFNLLSSSENKIVFEHELDYKVPTTRELNGILYQDLVKSYKITMMQSGAPALPMFAESVIIPNLGEISLSIEHDGFTEFENINVLPSKGSLKRNVNPEDIDYVFGEVYSQNEFFPGNLANLREPYILRNTRGATVEFFPLQYNPVTKKLRVYHNLRVAIKIDNKVTGQNELFSGLIHDDAFNSIYSNHYLNARQDKYTPVGESGELLIIAKDDYLDEIMPLALWKIQEGIRTIMVGTSTAGSTDTEIKNFIQNHYAANPNLTFVLLVGDHADVPSHTYGSSGGEQLWSDSYYGQLAGGSNDYYPEVFIGRFSGNASQITTMVNRAMEYEKNPATGNWMTKAIGLASDEGAGYGDEGESDWQHARNNRTKLLSFGYTEVYEFYDGSQGGADASGNPSSSTVSSAVNGGIGLFNYTGHGDLNTCITGNYSSSHINSGTNNGKYPFVISVACNNGTFTSGTCISESWLRATNAGSPTGAIAACGSSILMAWAEPMQTQDEMTDIITEAYVNNKKVTLGGIFYNGQMSMLEQYGNSNAREVMQTWIMFGDPSTMFRTKETMNLTASHVSHVALGISSVSVNCSVEGATVALVQNELILGKGVVSGGSATITFLPLSSISAISVTATKQNYKPYEGYILVANGIAGLDNLDANNFNAYPNPASDELIVEWNSIEGNSALNLYDLTGKLVYSKSISEMSVQEAIIPVSQMTSGVYFLKLEHELSTRSIKVIIE